MDSLRSEFEGEKDALIQKQAEHLHEQKMEYEQQIKVITTKFSEEVKNARLTAEQEFNVKLIDAENAFRAQEEEIIIKVQTLH